MHHSYSHRLPLALLALFAAGCDLDPINVGDSFRDGESSQSSGDEQPPIEPPDAETSGDAPPPIEPPDAETSGDAPPPIEPPDAETSDEEQPPSEPPSNPLHAAFVACAFNLVWTQVDGQGAGLALETGQVADLSESTVGFAPTWNNSIAFPSAFGKSALALELLEIDPFSGAYLIGAQVKSDSYVLTLPPLYVEPWDPYVLVDPLVETPNGHGVATWTSLIDNSQELIDIRWGLVVDVNGGDNPACEAIPWYP